MLGAFVCNQFLFQALFDQNKSGIIREPVTCSWKFILCSLCLNNFLYVFHCECFTVPLTSHICFVAGGQSDQGYDSLSKEEVRMGGEEEQDSSPHTKEKKETDSIPREL